jgi:hypothetical protein
MAMNSCASPTACQEIKHKHFQSHCYLEINRAIVIEIVLSDVGLDHLDWLCESVRQLVHSDTTILSQQTHQPLHLPPQ